MQSQNIRQPVIPARASSKAIQLTNLQHPQRTVNIPTKPLDAPTVSSASSNLLATYCDLMVEISSLLRAKESQSEFPSIPRRHDSMERPSASTSHHSISSTHSMTPSDALSSRKSPPALVLESPLPSPRLKTHDPESPHEKHASVYTVLFDDYEKDHSLEAAGGATPMERTSRSIAVYRPNRGSELVSLHLDELDEDAYLDEEQVGRVVTMLREKGLSVVEAPTVDDDTQCSEEGETAGRFCMVKDLLKGQVAWKLLQSIL